MEQPEWKRRGVEYKITGSLNQRIILYNFAILIALAKYDETELQIIYDNHQS